MDKGPASGATALSFADFPACIPVETFLASSSEKHELAMHTGLAKAQRPGKGSEAKLAPQGVSAHLKCGTAHPVVPKAQKPRRMYRELHHSPHIWHCIDAIAKHPAQPARGEAWGQVDVEASIPAASK